MKKILVTICVMFLACLCFAEENVRTHAEARRGMQFKVHLLAKEVRDLQGLLAKAGVEPVTGASAHYAYAGKYLVVVNTEANLEKIAAFVKSRGGMQLGAALPKSTIAEKMGKIVIPEIEFRKANIQEVVEFLNKAARENDKETSDPAMKGVKITLNLPDAALQACPPITFNTQNISLHDALEALTRMTGLECNMYLKLNTVVLVAGNPSARRDVSANNNTAVNAGSLQNTLAKKMAMIVIPKIEFRQASIRDVVEFLNKSAKENDTTTTNPELKGVKISLGLSETAIKSCPPITFSVRYIALSQVLKTICDVAGIEYDGDLTKNAIVLIPKDTLVRREFPATRTAIADLKKHSGGDLRLAIERITSLPPNAKVDYDTKRGMLIVESTLRNLHILESLLASLNR